MSQNTTIARPYAKAIFEFAQATGELPQWSTVLSVLSQAIGSPSTSEFINNPSATTQQHIELLEAVIPTNHGIKDPECIHNFLSVLAANKRLLLIPDIFELYSVLRAEAEKTLVADVHTYADLSKAQHEKLVDTLSKRLNRKVSLNIKIDPSLLGGALIQAGDLVIDGSVRGQLKKLGAAVAA